MKAIWGRDGEPNVPSYLYILGALRQIGVRADLQMRQETRRLSGDFPNDLAHQLAPGAATVTEVQRLADNLMPLLYHQADVWRYRYSIPVAVIMWRRAG